MFLHRHNRFVKQGSREVRIIAETFPVPSAANDSTKASSYRSKGDVGTFALELSSKMFLRLMYQLFVPGGAKVKT